MNRMKKAKVHLKDYINPGKDGLNQIIEIIWDDTISTR